MWHIFKKIKRFKILWLTMHTSYTTSDSAPLSRLLWPVLGPREEPAWAGRGQEGGSQLGLRALGNEVKRKDRAGKPGYFTPGTGLGLCRPHCQEL